MSTHRRGVRPSQWPVRDLLGPENGRTRFWDARVGAAAAGLLACGAAVTVVLTSGSRPVSDQTLETPGAPLALPAPVPVVPPPAGPVVPPPAAPPAAAAPQVAEPRLPARDVVAPRPRSPSHGTAALRRATARRYPRRRHATFPWKEPRRRRTGPLLSRSPRPSKGGRAGRGRTGRSSGGSWCRFSGRPMRRRCSISRVPTSLATRGAPAVGTGPGTAIAGSGWSGNRRTVAAGTARRTATVRTGVGGIVHRITTISDPRRTGS